MSLLYRYEDAASAHFGDLGDGGKERKRRSFDLRRKVSL